MIQVNIIKQYKRQTIHKTATDRQKQKKTDKQKRHIGRQANTEREKREGKKSSLVQKDDILYDKCF